MRTDHTRRLRSPAWQLTGHNATMHAAADDDYRFMRADTSGDPAGARRAMERHVRDTGRALNLMLTTLGS